MSNLNDRNTFITFSPTTGNDPLSDKLLGKLRLLPSSGPYMIQKNNEYRPDKIAAKFFKDSALYWAILEYNNLLSFTALVAGLTINIPDIRYLNNLLLSSTKTNTTSILYLK